MWDGTVEAAVFRLSPQAQLAGRATLAWVFRGCDTAGATMNDLVAQVKRMSGSPRSAPPRRSEPSASAR